MHYLATRPCTTEEKQRVEYTALVILAALAQYLYFTIRVGAARGKYHIEAPATRGDEAWERLFRVQQNTLEQLIAFIPALVLFGWYLSGTWVVLPGLVFLVGRQLYAHEYVSNPKSRALGMGLTFLATAALVIGALVGIILKMI
jgi:glutathione S-transferase